MDTAKLPMAHLIRTTEKDGATWGFLIFGNMAYHSMELPWRDNQPDISCIPAGDYVALRDHTGKNQYFRIENVPGRTGLEIHVANYPAELKGCLALGLAIHSQVGDDCGRPDGARYLAHSRAAMEQLLRTAPEGFRLKIYPPDQL